MSKVLRRVVLVSGVVAGSLGFAMNSQAALPFFSTDKAEVPSLAPMLEQATPAVVSIAVKGTQTSTTRVPEMFRYYFGGPREQVQEKPFQGLGSGVIIDAEKGYVVTNNHVVANADEITVQLTDGREIEAKKVGAAPESDIALLQIQSDDLVALPLSNSDELRVGDFVVAIGNPFGLSQTVTSGIVSALGRSGLNIGGYETFIQTDAAINRGNSGGALVNLHGELVGINTAIFGPNGGNVGIGFAIPSNMMKNLVDQLIEFGEVRPGLLGISGSDLDSSLADAMKSDIKRGAFVNEVSDDSAASKAGIQAGDIIIAVNGKALTNFQQLRAKIASMGAGAEVELTIVRKGEQIDVMAVLDSGAQQATVAAKELHPALEGASFESGADEAGNAGVLIADVERGSPAFAVGLRNGDIIVSVNDQRVKNVGELQSAFEEDRNVIALSIRRGDSTIYRIIR